MSFLLKAVDYAHHPKGPTHTAKYGDLRGDSAAKQRRDNTRISDAASMHDMDRQLAQKMKETADMEAATQASLNELAVDHFDPDQMAAATQQDPVRGPMYDT